MKYQPIALIAAALYAAAGMATAVAQVKPAAVSDDMPDQLMLSYMRTDVDYSLLTYSGEIEPVRLNGGAVEYASRRYYPFELIGSARYSVGEPLSQHLLTLAGGIGYTREWVHRDHFWQRFDPYGSFQAGYARTSSDSTDGMYLYPSSRAGFTTLISAGLDAQINRGLAIRPIYVENQYLPFGTSGSTYWNIGAGIGINLDYRRIEDHIVR